MAPEDKSKAVKFINYLMNSPQIKGESFLSAESMIHSFIAQNRDQLKLTFRGQQYFPDLDGEDAIRLLVSELYMMVKDQIFKPLLPFINDTDFGFLNKIAEQQLPPQYHREKIDELVKMLVKIREVRSGFLPAYNLISTGAVDRYITDIFKRRDFIYNEIVRVQKTFLEVDEYISFFKLLLILKHAALMKTALIGGDAEHRYSLADVLKMPGKIELYIDSVHGTIAKTAPNISRRMTALALRGNLPESMTSVDEGSSRLLYVLSTRYHSYKPVSRQDRGAESPDKSWFAIARKNASTLGFERRMLDELYRIAGDNSW
jgi:DNA-binding protein Fis